MSILLRKRPKKNGKKSKTHLTKRSLKEKDVGNSPVLIFDSTALCHAAFHAYGDLSYNGKPTAVIYGFLNRVFRAAKKFKTKNLIFCWDAGYSWRLVNYPQYKQKRKEKYEDMVPEEKERYNNRKLQELQLHNEILPNMGLRNTFCFNKYEGDDLIGKIVKSHFPNNRKVIFTSDNDLYQLLDKADIYLLHKKKLFTHENFQEMYGIHADQWPIAKAIGGCNGDNVIGINGIGDPKSPKSMALKYIKGDLKKDSKAYQKIKNGKDIITTNLPLVTVPYMENEMPEFRFRKNRVTRKKLIKVFDKYRFISFLEDDKLKKWERRFV